MKKVILAVAVSLILAGAASAHKDVAAHVVAGAVKVASQPVRHPVKDSKATGKATAKVARPAYKVFRAVV